MTCDPSACRFRDRASRCASAYAYLLGVYLGDGSISRVRSTLRLRIVLDERYPLILRETALATRRVFGKSAIHRHGPGALAVSVYSNHLVCLFPQHGIGVKHNRDVRLKDWQRQIVATAPHALVRGLIHSDGCRVTNRVGKYTYIRYFLSNRSADIHTEFRDACGLLGVDWSASRADTTSIARRSSVAALDRMVGPKR